MRWRTASVSCQLWWAPPTSRLSSLWLCNHYAVRMYSSAGQTHTHTHTHYLRTDLHTNTLTRMRTHTRTQMMKDALQTQTHTLSHTHTHTHTIVCYSVVFQMSVCSIVQFLR